MSVRVREKDQMKKRAKAKRKKNSMYSKWEGILGLEGDWDWDLGWRVTSSRPYDETAIE